MFVASGKRVTDGRDKFEVLGLQELQVQPGRQ